MKLEPGERFFWWDLPSEEVAWHRAGRSAEESWVIEDKGRSFPAKRYFPLDDEPGLFRRFGELGTQLTPEKVQEFARQFGLLGFPVGKETFEVWQDNIAAMQKCVRWWDLLQSGKESELRNELGRLKTGFDSDARDAFERGDSVVPVLFLINREVTPRLQAHVRPVLKYDRMQNRERLELVPANLLGALWLQLAETISRGKVHRQCEVCERWFEIAPGTNRSDRRYCSDACKVRADRAKVAKALELLRKGAEPKDVAAQLGMNLKRVKKLAQYGS